MELRRLWLWSWLPLDPWPWFSRRCDKCSVRAPGTRVLIWHISERRFNLATSNSGKGHACGLTLELASSSMAMNTVQLSERPTTTWGPLLF